MKPCIERRHFLKSFGATISLTLSVRLSGVVAAEAEARFGADAMPGGVVDAPLVFVSIAENGDVAITCHRPEMGQGIRTSLPLVIADELEADWSRVRVVQAPGDESKYGNQDTDGSRSMRHFFEPMRRVGAAMRMMLEAAAAAEWAVPVSEVRALNHEVIHASTGRRLGYGALARAAAFQSVPAREALKLKNPSEFRYIGREQVCSVDAVNMVSGNAVYSIDVQFDNMLYAVVARPPVYGGRVKAFDATDANKVRGVVRITELKGNPPPPMMHPLGGVAVIAKDTWSAIKGRNALKITWDAGPNASYNSESFKAMLEARAHQSDVASYHPDMANDAASTVVRDEGNTLAVLAKATRRIEAEYYIPHVAHATMEPPTATARIVDGRCEVWAGVQAPQGTREIIAAHLGFKPEKVMVHVPLLGGGFGRKSMPDFAVEAALLSQAMNGAPVKVTWTREDDLRHDYYHTVSVERLEAALDEHGKPTAWLHRSVAPTIASTFVVGAQGQQPFEVGMTAIGVPFEIPNIRLEAPGVPAHTRIGWFRSVSNIPHAFAVQCFVAELAAAAGRDPKDYLLELIGPPRRIDTRTQSDTWNYRESPELYPLDTGRLRNVIEVAARQAHWGRQLPKGRGLGIAATYSFLTYVAAVADVSVDPNGELIVNRFDVAVDCGPQINPDRIRAQVEGSCIMGTSLALNEEITFTGGRVRQSNFHDYPVIRMNAAPREIRVHLVPFSWETPLGGIGEPAVPPIAPALLNAVYAATGKRIRRLPIGGQLKT